MMQELLGLRKALFASKALDFKQVYDRKKEIIQRNLYTGPTKTRLPSTSPCCGSGCRLSSKTGGTRCMIRRGRERCRT